MCDPITIAAVSTAAVGAVATGVNAINGPPGMNLKVPRFDEPEENRPDNRRRTDEERQRAPVVGDDRDEEIQRRRGRDALKIALNIPDDEGGSGLNIPS